jgi:phenylalanyl-tRNA synthetase alpha chain
LPKEKASPYTVPKLKTFSGPTLQKASNTLLAALEQECDLLLNFASDPTIDSIQKSQRYKFFRDRWLGRKNGHLAQINETWLEAAPKDEKRGVGQQVNEIKKSVEIKITDIQEKFELLARQSPAALRSLDRLVDNADPQSQPIDITLPGIHRPLGAEHPVIKTMNEIVSVFRDIGYSVQEGPEIETDYYNFEALNFPPNHPARDTQDTLFIANQESRPARDRLLLRTHTSPVQIRTMEKMKPPLRIVIPGKVHRNDAPDATHSPIFHQVEGLAVDTDITFSDLKGTLDHAMKALFGSSVKTRFYPSFFPFTEPSADVQISCIFCGGKGYRDGNRCPNCKASGWIELLGCGMVDPNVFGFVDYDSTKVSGFAFGMGVERIAILKYGVDDIQLFYQGDVRFLEQFL